MIDTILRKTLYKEYSQETQNTVLYLSKPEILLNFICNFLFVFFLLFIILILPIIFPILFETLISQLVYLTVSFFYTLFIVLIFRKRTFYASNLLSRFLHYLFFTKQGKAISKGDFKIIKKDDKLLYSTIVEQDCRGRCYAVCFALLQALKKGTMQFISVKEFTKENETPFDTIHVLYVNQGYAFDAYSHRQFPVNTLLAVHQSKIYKNFNYEDVKYCSYEEFRDINYAEFAKWCKENDVHELWNCD